MRASQGRLFSAIVRAIHACGLSTVSLRQLLPRAGGNSLDSPILVQ